MSVRTPSAETDITRFSFRIHQSLLNKLDESAKRNRRSLNSEILQILEEYLKRE